MSAELVSQSAVGRNAMSALTEQLQLSDPGEVYGILKNSIMPKASDSDIAAFAITCAQYRLNPFIKEVYAFPTKAGGVQPMVSIDGWLKIAHNHPDYDGMSWQDGGEADDRWCECTVYLKSTPDHPVTVREYMQECRMQTEPWRMRPRRMLRHRATIQAIRYAFGVAGIADKEDFVDDFQESPKPGSMQLRQAVGKQPRLAPVPVPLPVPETAGAEVAADVAAGAEAEVESDTPGADGAFERLSAMLKDAGKRWNDASRVLQGLNVKVPLGAGREEMDKFAAWVFSQRELMAELEAKLGINVNLI